MKKFTILLCLSIILVISNLKAQENKMFAANSDVFSLGLGGGLDCGGFGGNLLVYPGKNFGLFGGVGYALAGVGYNFGAKYRLISKKGAAKSVPFFLAMYGYNAAIGVKNMEQLNKLFYGPSLGFGWDFRSKPMRKGYWTFALLLPIRSADVNTYIDHLKKDHYVKFDNILLPVTLSIGYRIILN